MNQGDSRKDQPGFFSRRRQSAFDLEESSRNGGQFTSSIQSLPYSNGIAASQRQHFSYWPPQSYHRHHVGVIHRYPGHQMFLQHGPFGGDNHQYRPVGYLPQFHMRFPQNSDLQHSSLFNSESRRNGFDFQSDRRQFEDGKNRFDFGGLGYNERGVKTEEGARPKPGRFSCSKNKVFKKRNNRNNSSNVSVADGDIARMENKVRRRRKSNNELTENEKIVGTSNLCTETGCPEENDISQTLNSDTDGVYCERRISDSSAANGGDSNTLNFCDEEGAVGGKISDLCKDVLVGEVVSEDRKLERCSFDKNLIDEGAVCDLDRIFQSQEFSHYNDGFQSDPDQRNCVGQGNEELSLTSSKQSSNKLFQNTSDDESESENCSYVFNPQFTLLSSDVLCPENALYPGERPSSCPQSLNRFHFNEDKRGDVSGEGRLGGAVGNGHVGNNSDDGEDNGDFIDADLPTHNKHILSSSDEMDSVSSNSSSDHEGSAELCNNYTARKIVNAEFNCNNLSTEPNVKNDLAALSICDSAVKGNTSLSSHIQGDGNAESSKVSPLPVRKIASYSSSESENEDSSPLDFHSLLNSDEISPTPYMCYSSTSSCLDGAAASQVSSESFQKLPDNHYNSCPPGAECELAQASPPQCFFHSKTFCHPTRHGSFNNSKCNYTPGREHNAFTASSAPETPESCNQMHKEGFAGSATSSSGACCSSAYQMSQLNYLNACCLDRCLPDGLSHDRPETNFSNDESNRHQKVFVKFPVEDKLEDRESHSASSGDLEDTDGLSLSGRKQDKSSDSGGSEDPLSHDSGDNVEMVLLPMEEEIEPVHHMGASLCAGGVDDNDELFQDIQLATSSGLRGADISHLCDEHQFLCLHDQNPLRNGMPSKEFYDLIKTVSTTDSYMRFFDKDGQDVQRQPVIACDDDDDENSKQNSPAGGQTSKTERLKVDRVMIWNEYEAYVMQFKQIAVSACGQTAVLNVLKALKFNFEKSAVCKIIQTSLRKEDASIPEYLFSRAKAGTTAEELMLGVEKLSGGAVGSRFFHFWPPRNVKLLQWLAYWMKRGAIPIATLNLQQGPHSLWQVPDSWHHQMVYGVSHQGLYLTNPLEIVSERSAMKQLCSDSVLMVRRQDIISRFRETTDLCQLLNHTDPRWRTMNVLGQVVNVLREFNMPSVPGYRLQVTSHVTIPASYKAGITLFMPKDKSAWAALMNAPEIPLQE